MSENIFGSANSLFNNIVDSAKIPGTPANQVTEFRPTLVIGLGGTGHTVLTQLKARYLDSFGEDIFNPKVLRLIAIDTADEVVTVESEKNGPVNLERGREFVFIGGVPVQSILANLRNRKYIEEWFPKEFQARNITQGAQQVRALGRLALFHHSSTLIGRLKDATSSLSSIRGEGIHSTYFRVPPNTGINIYIVCSVCGGTGSGTFLDIAYIMRYLCRAMPFHHVNGYLVLPQAFSNVPGEGIQANAMAALREMDYFNEFGKFEAEYANEKVHLSYTRPFDICYLIDGVNERHKTLNGLNELAPLVSEAIFLQTGSQVGEANLSAFDNVKTLGQVDSGRPTAYSGVGTASLYFPAASIVKICAARYGRQLIKDGLLSNEPKFPMVEQQARNFLGGANLEAPALLSELQKAQQGSAIIIRLDVSGLAEVGPTEVLGQVDNIVTDFQQNYLNGLYRNTIEANRTRLQNDINNRLSKELRRFTDDSREYGLLFGIAFLDSLRTYLNKLAGFLDQERTNYSADYEHQQPEVQASRNNIINAANSLPIGRGGRLKKARAEYLEICQRSFTVQFELISRQQAAVLISNILSTIGYAQSSLNKLLEHLRAATDNLAQRARILQAEKGNSLSPLTNDITNDEDIERYYNRFAAPVRQAIVQLLERTGGFFTWVNLPYPEVENRILEYSNLIFEPINKIRIEEVLSEKRGEQSPEARLDKLLQDALPFWNYDQARLTGSGELHPIIVLGSEDSTKTIFQERAAMRIVTTRDPHRINLLHTKHGLPLFALTQFPEYRERYDNFKRRNINPLHLWQNLPFSDDSNEREAWQLFALADALGMVQLSGVNYDYVPDDKLKPSLKLGQGLANALAAFSQNEEVRQEVNSRLQQLLARKGAEQVLNQVRKYIEPPKRPSSNNSQVEDLRNTLRLLAREYINSVE